MKLSDINLNIFATIISMVLCSVSHVAAQKDIEIIAEYDEKNMRYDIIAINQTKLSHVVKIDFTELSNLRVKGGGEEIKRTSLPGRKRLVSLHRVNQERGTSYNYRSTHLIGCVSTKPKFDHPYLIPVKPGKETLIRKMSFLGEKYGADSAPQGWCSYAISTEPGDTIYAARSGRVGRIKLEDDPELDGVLFSRHTNSILIEHDDCTFANYAIFDENGLMVKEGDIVYAGDPIARASGTNYDMGSHLRFSVYYYRENEKLKNGIVVDKPYYWSFLTPKLYVDNEVISPIDGQYYRSIHPENIIELELSKRQKKKRKKKQKA